MTGECSITCHLAAIRAKAEKLSIDAEVEMDVGGPDEFEVFVPYAGDMAEQMLNEINRVVEHLAELGLVDPDAINDTDRD